MIFFLYADVGQDVLHFSLVFFISFVGLIGLLSYSDVFNRIITMKRHSV